MVSSSGMSGDVSGLEKFHNLRESARTRFTRSSSHDKLKRLIDEKKASFAVEESKTIKAGEEVFKTMGTALKSLNKNLMYSQNSKISGENIQAIGLGQTIDRMA